MPNYILRDVDPRLWRDAKARVDREGRSLKFVLISLLQEYVAHGLRQDAHVAAKRSNGPTTRAPR